VTETRAIDALAPAALPVSVPYREVRHERPEDCLHHEAIGIRGRLHGWSIPAHRHDGLHQFQLLQRGAARVTIDTEMHHVTAPVALMIAPGAVHHFVYEADSEGQQVTVPSVALQQGLSSASGLVGQLSRSLLLQPEGRDLDTVTSLFDQMAEEFAVARPGRIESLRARALVLSLWFLRNAGLPSPELRQRALRDTLVQRFKSLLEQRYRSHWTIQDYAAELRVTADHLSRACKSIGGQSALDIVQDRLLLEARRLLAYGTASVQDVALELGFEDASYFSRFFSRRAGQSPSAYRLAAHLGMAPQVIGAEATPHD
jgi:AraC family transcriptional activator of pobA